MLQWLFSWDYPATNPIPHNNHSFGPQNVQIHPPNQGFWMVLVGWWCRSSPWAWLRRATSWKPRRLSWWTSWLPCSMCRGANAGKGCCWPTIPLLRNQVGKLINIGEPFLKSTKLAIFEKWFPCWNAWMKSLRCCCVPCSDMADHLMPTPRTASEIQEISGGHGAIHSEIGNQFTNPLGDRIQKKRRKRPMEAGCTFYSLGSQRRNLEAWWCLMSCLNLTTLEEIVACLKSLCPF